jgi:hypothetical protein
MMFVLSATGAPLALVNRVGDDMGLFLCVADAVHCGQADSRITRQKFIGLKFGSLSASTSAFTLPKVVSGL